jgi:hypothetical protein
MSDEALVLAVLHGLSIPEFRAEILTSLGKLAECEQCHGKYWRTRKDQRICSGTECRRKQQNGYALSWYHRRK